MRKYLVLLVIITMAVTVFFGASVVRDVSGAPDKGCPLVCIGSECRFVGPNKVPTCMGPPGFGLSPPEPIPPQTFVSPASTESFSGLMCSFAVFMSRVVLPPIAVLMALVVGFLFMTSGGEPARAVAARKALLFTVAGVALLLLAPGIVSLISSLLNSPLAETAACAALTIPSTIADIAIRLLNWFSWFIAVTSVLMGLYAGFLYMTANSNPANTAKAAKTLSFTIIGVAVAVAAFSIIALVKNFLG